jgi:malonyl-CoA O-methyltransferase
MPVSKTLKYYFNRAVNTYEQAGKIQKIVSEDILQRIPLTHYDTIVEIGSGKGFLSEYISSNFSFKRYIHIDISFDFLKRLRKKLKINNFFINSDGENIPLRNNTAELLLSSSCIHWFDNPEKTIPALFDILLSGGRFFFSIFTSETLQELKQASDFSGFGSIYPLREAEFYVELIKKLSFIFSYDVKTYKIYYPSVKDLLMSHKLTGTNYTKEKKFTGKDKFKKFCDFYSRYFSDNNGVYATYEVLFIEGQKLSLFHQYQPLKP